MLIKKCKTNALKNNKPNKKINGHIQQQLFKRDRLIFFTSLVFSYCDNNSRIEQSYKLLVGCF